jgi:transposase
MMRTKIRSFAPLPDDVSLEGLVPKDNFYRRLEARLDLSFARELVEPLYAKGGRPSVDPVVFFKLQLVMFFEDLRSERRLMRAVADRLSVRWYLGYDLFEPLPDHSSLTRIRERYGLSVFRCFLERIVEMCFEAGLVGGEELLFDATKVVANASIDSTRSRSLLGRRLEKHLAATFPEDVLPVQEEDHSGVIAGFVGPRGDQRRPLARMNALRHRWIAGSGRRERSVATWGYTRMADMRASTTDPDASPMHHKNKSSGRLGYLTHYVVDGGRARGLERAGHGGRGHGEPTHATDALREHLPLGPASALCDRRRSLRHEAERGCQREGGHPRLHRAARARKTHLPFHHRGLHLRRRKRPLHLPCGRNLAPPGPRSQGRVRKVRRQDGRM